MGRGGHQSFLGTADLQILRKTCPTSVFSSCHMLNKDFSASIRDLDTLSDAWFSSP